MKVKVTCFFVLWASFFITPAMAQLLPADQPEQDACHALRLCGNRFYTPYSYQKIGQKSDLPGTPCSSGEANSVWIRVEVKIAGSIVFTLDPVNTLDDYDFAVVDVTGKHCDSIRSSDVVRCNFNNNLSSGGNYEGPIIGLNTVSTLSFVPAGTSGSNFLKQIDAAAGDIYLIMINNFGAGGGPSSGFTIDFTGTTAIFVTDGPPGYDTVEFACGTADTLHVYMDAHVQCSSIAADGSDFQLFPPLANIKSAYGINCGSSNGYTDYIILTLDQPLAAGAYSLRPKTGTDGNTLLSLCMEEQLLSDRMSFDVVKPALSLPEDNITTCMNNPVHLKAEVSGVSGGYNIQWSPPTYLDNSVIPDPVCVPGGDIVYDITLSSAVKPECRVMGTVRVNVLKGFALLNKDTTICIGDTITLAVLGDDRYQYSWTPSEGLSLDTGIHHILATPQSNTVYQVTATYPGCTDSAQSVRIDIDMSRRNSFISFAVDHHRICLGESVMISPKTDSATLELHWNINRDSSIKASSKEVFKYAWDETGSMPLMVTAHYPACPSVSFADTITVYPLPRINLGKDTSICIGGVPLSLSNLNPHVDGYRYHWSTGDTTKYIQIRHDGDYTLSITTEKGCVNTESISVKKNCFTDIPNAFTPNGDGVNDYFFPRQLLTNGGRTFQMRIYTRWGQMVYETSGVEGRGWDGRFNGREQPPGVYIYQVEINYDNGQFEDYRGNITLIR